MLDLFFLCFVSYIIFVVDLHKVQCATDLHISDSWHPQTTDNRQ